MAARLPVLPADAEWHGTPQGYQRHLCGCQDCRTANRVAIFGAPEPISAAAYVRLQDGRAGNRGAHSASTFARRTANRMR